MNIVLCSREFPGINPSGGIGVYVRAVARVLVEQGHVVLVITEGKKVELSEHPEGFDVQTIKSIEGFKTDPHGYSYQLYKKLRHLHQTRHFDVIEFPEYQGEAYFAVKAKRLLGEFSDVTLAVHSHMSLELCDRLNDEFTVLYRQAIFNIERYALKYADRVTVPSEDLRDLYHHDIPRSYLLKSHPMPHFTTRMAPRPRRDAVPVLLYVGRMEHRKGVDLFIDAAIRLMTAGVKFRARLVGGDTWRQEVSYRAYLLKRIPKEFTQNFEFVGPVHRDALTREYEAATALVFPSRFENWPNVCLEAMSYGKAIVASKHGGMREMLADGAGLLVDPLDPADLDQALLQVVNEPTIVERLGHSALARYEEFEHQPHFDYGTLLPSVTVSEPSQENWPLVSVVVPSFNAASTIEETVRSLNQLDYPNYEILLIDDGSTDGNFSLLLDRLGQKYHRIRVFHKTNSGLPGARNYGARMAAGEYLAFCDADDLLQRNLIREAVTALKAHPELSAVYPILRYWGEIKGLWGPQDIYLPTILAENQAHAGLVIHREVFEALEGYDESFVFGWEDWDLAIRFAKAGYTGEVLPREGYIYRVHNASMVRTTTYERRVTMYRQLWRKHEELLGTSGAFVLDRELTLPSRGYDDLPHEMWLRERLLQSKPVRLVLFVARFVPKPIKSPIRKMVRAMVLRGVR